MKTIVSFAIAILCSSILFGIASAQEDVTPPTLVDVSFSPDTFDTGTGPVTVTVTAHITDDLSGVASAALFLRLPGTTQKHQVEFRPNTSFGDMIEGDMLDGRHQATMVIPQYAAYGSWEVYMIHLGDAVGNRTDKWKPEPQDGKTLQSDEWPSLFNEFGFLVTSGNPENVSELNHSLYLPMTLH